MKIMLRCLLVGLLLPMGMLQGCRTPDQPTPAEQPDEKPDDKPDEPPVVKSDPVRIVLTKANIANMDYTYDESSDTYTVTTTSDDPYVFSERLAADLPDDCVVLAFEYTSARDVDDFQLYFPPLSEARSGHYGAMAKTTAFKPFACLIEADMLKFNWGSANQFLRLDFGHTANNTLKIRNIQIRPMTEEEERARNEKLENDKSKEAQALRIRDYLGKQYPSAVTDVTVSATEVTVTGTAAGTDGYFLAEVTPYDPFTEAGTFSRKTPLTGRSFTVTLPRRASCDGFTYDRLLSRWVVVKGDGIDSHARYADKITGVSSLPEATLKSKKGLGGFFGESTQIADLDALGITSVTVNVVLNAVISPVRTGQFTQEHVYGGKTYYISTSEQSSLDNVMLACSRRNIVVSAILLAQRNTDTPTGRILTHPEATGGPYSMPNMTTAESVNLYAAVLDWLASRYSGVVYGRIHHWILHNEIDFQKEWTNMGDQPELLYMDAYVKSMRMANLIARKYDAHAASLISLTHCWTKADGQFAPKDLLEDLKACSAAEGDFRWGVAAHPYPQSLSQPAFWKNDTQSTYGRNTSYITFKNLEVLSDWALRAENKAADGRKRIVFLSENGTNSPSYSDADLALQAAGACWMWKKVSRLPGIDAVQWHNWRDNKAEGGLRIGLRKFPESPDNGAVKPVWNVYRAAGTSNEEKVFAPYLPVIGIASWEEIHHEVE